MTKGYRAGSDDESGLRRLLAPNPSPMTGPGTNTFILGDRDLAVIDPGPALPAHLDAIQNVIAGRQVRGIFVTHAHLDHSAGARPLAEITGAPVLAFGPAVAGRSEIMARLAPQVKGGEGIDAEFAPDQMLSHGDQVQGDGWCLRAVHTPGHMSNHLSFQWPDARLVFTGDTVMGWASTLISPPDGDLGQFLTSLDRLADLGAERFWPGHGDMITDPSGRCAELRAHRLMREADILGALRHPRRVSDLVHEIYTDTPRALHAAAGRNVLAHLIHLWETGRVAAAPEVSPGALWHLI
ncbi:MBL fold hydrolase [Jannaschia pagri]|uniref:MBL fold hydrolase n=1 Tax=Jannaschia pagri TaxID=2829797 RepID=A0ABQ4NMV5_9RHOB|nr:MULTISPECIES: MBL fold metallo-hydrolase [unclassified Jannaschia]GIT91746.1 MBL fold hydrolase [Jannaschia sp. AI_61]GIT95580.1 MBL fold hydrolase [Jannaschia sp. AI_62]